MTACPNSADGQHHSDSYFEDRENGYYTSVCVHCGKTFTAHASDLSAAYDDYVTTLPATGYDSSGGLLWSPSFAGISCGYGNSYNRFCSHASYASTGNNKVDSDRIGKDYLYSCGCESGGHFFISHVNSTMASNCTFFCYYFLGNVPLSGMYTLLSGPGGTVSFGLNGGSFRKISADFIEKKSVFYAESAPVRYTFKIPMGGSVSFSVLSADCNLPVYKIIPAAPFPQTPTTSPSAPPPSLAETTAS